MNTVTLSQNPYLCQCAVANESHHCSKEACAMRRCFAPFRALGGACLLAVLLAAAAVAQAQAAYPARPITLIVPFGPGSTTDTLARVVADGLAAPARVDGTSRTARRERNMVLPRQLGRPRRLHTAGGAHQHERGESKPVQESAL